MKAITLWQPWASLIALGLKQYETRSWATNYRGPLVIHASKKNDAEIRDYCQQPDIKAGLQAHNLNSYDLPYGAALCVCTLVDCIPTERAIRSISLQESAFGDYSRGRFAWKLGNVQAFYEFIPCRGAQGLWEWTIPLPEEVEG